jgi:hypothetical protein
MLPFVIIPILQYHLTLSHNVIISCNHSMLKFPSMLSFHFISRCFHPMFPFDGIIDESSNVTIPYQYPMLSSHVITPKYSIIYYPLLPYHPFLSSQVVIPCYHPMPFIHCYHQMLSPTVIIPCYHLQLSSHVITYSYHPMLSSHDIIPSDNSLRLYYS